MGYDLHITRKDDWSDTKGPDITLGEWLDHIAIDKSLLLDPSFEGDRDPGVATGAKDASLAVWTGWPSREEGKREAWLWLSHGNLMATDPDLAMRQKMFLIADGLDAKLQGDDGEYYNSLGGAEGRARLTEDGRRKRWWKFW